MPIDHGNNRIKTLTRSFTSGCMESGHLPAMGGDVLIYQGKEYTLSGKRMAQKNDKTEDDNFFILTLFAIGKELLENPKHSAIIQPHSLVLVELLIGLPPLHYKAMYKRFEEYFTRRSPRISFELNKKPLTVEITGAQAYPQAYAAAITVYDKIKDSHMVNIVDIGGYTVDCLRLSKMQPDMGVCTSLYMGINTLFQKINEQVRATGAQDIQDSIIEAVLMDDWKVISDYSPSRIELVRNTAQKFCAELLSEVSQTGLDLAENKTVFVGGGSILLKDYLIQTGKAAKAVYVDDIHANAKGYYLLHNMANAATA
jgi:plasmid segregation protein ParM